MRTHGSGADSQGLRRDLRALAETDAHQDLAFAFGEQSTGCPAIGRPAAAHRRHESIGQERVEMAFPGLVDQTPAR